MNARTTIATFPVPISLGTDGFALDVQAMQRHRTTGRLFRFRHHQQPSGGRIDGDRGNWMLGKTRRQREPKLVPPPERHSYMPLT
jgi:hypothetical protein